MTQQITTPAPNTLSTLSVDFESGKQQLAANLVATGSAWKAVVPTETGDTIMSFIATVHASAQQNILRSFQDTYPDTAVADTAVYAAATMQGVRLNRHNPASMTVILSNRGLTPVTLPPMSVFSGANTYWFTRNTVVVPANDGTENGDGKASATFYQGLVTQVTFNGLGSDYQLWISPESAFSVSDTDVYVAINGVSVPRATTGLWNNGTGKPESLGFLDRTLPNGALVVEFGDGSYGARPGTQDQVTVVYAVTNGNSGNSINALSKTLVCASNSFISANAVTNPTGGSNQTPALRYKNIAAYSFGTFGAAVTRSQHVTTILQYPGIVDAITFSQREVNPSDPRWMNLVQVSLLTSSAWDSNNISTFLEWLQTVTQYTTRFVYVPPVKVINNIALTVYCYNWANLDTAVAAASKAVSSVFSKATLNYDVYLSDIYNAVLDSYSGIEYLDINNPSTDMIVSQPVIGNATVDVSGTEGTLLPGVYTYGIGYTDGKGNLVTPKKFSYAYVTSLGQKPTIRWGRLSSASGVASYQIYGRGQESSWGVVGSVTGTEFTDDGQAVPAVVPKLSNFITKPVGYNVLGTLSIVPQFSTRTSRI